MVRSSPLFEGLASRHVADLLRKGGVRRCPRGTVLFIENEPADCFFMVLEGWVKLSRLTAEGDEITLGLFSRGDSLAEAILQQPERYAMTGQAVEPSRVLAIPAQIFLEQVSSSRELCRNTMLLMARRLLAAQQQLEQISRHPTVQRVALFLLRLCRCQRGAATVELPLDKTFIAARLGMQPETLSRAFAKLRQHGVEVNGDRVSIEEVARLQAFAAGRHN
ncbi:Crp/Fnr family transcriptional regulator [Benzoatithermus flavus]|uniref:Crp/Fnr family transcriptional regulator n=1 Tax=Benzoatithermus flavus TaxID=3108223 RepID=A0ABU8XVG9_9PROT